MNMVALMVVMMMLAVALLIISLEGAAARDADPLQDFCIPTSSSKVGGGAGGCKAAGEVVAEDFWSRVLASPPANWTGGGNSKKSLAVAMATAANVGGLNGQGLSMLRVDYAGGGGGSGGGGGIVPPHVHPRASEIIYVLAGTLHVGFVDSSGSLFSRTLAAGDLFVFPRGLLHFIFNAADSPAASLSAFDSQNPGTSLLPSALFASRPALPDSLLLNSFRISPLDLRRIRQSFSVPLPPPPHLHRP